MEYSVRVSDDRTHIILKITGDFKGGDMLKAILEAHVVGRQTGLKRFIVDVREGRNVDSAVEDYEFAYSDIKKTEGIDLDARVATLVSPGDRSHDFIETVMSNAGLPLKYFTDMGSALEFIMRK